MRGKILLFFLFFCFFFILGSKNSVFATTCPAGQCISCPSNYTWNTTYQLCCQTPACQTPDGIEPACNTCSNGQTCNPGQGCIAPEPPLTGICGNHNPPYNKCCGGYDNPSCSETLLPTWQEGICYCMTPEENCETFTVKAWSKEKNSCLDKLFLLNEENCPNGWEKETVKEAVSGNIFYQCRYAEQIISPIQPSFCNGDQGIKTAIGCIPTDPQALISKLLPWIIGLAGGIAFILMLFGAFQIMTSAGNPEKLKAGQERLTSAIIGLLLIIFSVFLMRIIGIPIIEISK